MVRLFVGTECKLHELRTKYRCSEIATGYKNKYTGDGLINPITIVAGSKIRKMPMPIFQPLCGVSER